MATQKGIIINKAEIAALLEFAGRDTESALSAVQFRTEGDGLVVCASDGHRCIEARGMVDKLKRRPDGEWALGREFLTELRKLLGADDRAVLVVSGASLHEAVVEDEAGEPRSTLHWPTDAASAQMTSPALRSVVQLPRKSKRVTCMTLNPAYLASVALVARAAHRGVVDIYVPETRESPIAFRVEGLGVTWTGVIMPCQGDEEYEGGGPDEAP